MCHLDFPALTHFDLNGRSIITFLFYLEVILEENRTVFLDIRSVIIAIVSMQEEIFLQCMTQH